MSTYRLLFSLVFLMCLCGTLLTAQTETGQLTGTVFDPAGAVLPRATVTATDTATRNTRSTMASAAGTYVLPNLLPGVYEVTAAAPGFQTTKQTAKVNVGAPTGVDFHLTLGPETTVVEVTENVTQVNTENQTLAQRITGTDIVELPTLTRNPYDLVKIAGNVSEGDPSGRGVGVSVNGQRASSVNLLLDGVPNNNEYDTTVGIKTPLDSVGEFTLITSSFTAEFGRAAGGVVNVETKRGTNGFHGTAYEFNRASALASNTFENNADGIIKPVFIRNQFGFSIGGPILKDKLFVFANPEWTRVRSQLIQTYTIAAPELIAASAPATQAFFAAFGQRKPGLIPVQTFTYGQACTSPACTLLPAGTPAYQKVAYSVPADSGGGDPQNTYAIAGRVDYNLTDRTQIYFRYAAFDQNALLGAQTNSPYVGFDTAYFFHNTGEAVSLTHIFGPTLVSQTKLSYNRLSNDQPLGARPVVPTLYTTLTTTSSIGGSSVVYPGYSPNTPGNSIPFGGPQHYFQINQDFTKTIGKHNFRFGGQFDYIQDNRTFGAYEEAVEALGTSLATSINGLITGQLHDFQAAIYPQGKFPCVSNPTLIVTPDCTLTLPVGPPNFSRSNRYHEAALYAQDSWKVTPRLTVNLGLRWEYFGPQANANPSLDSNFYLGPGANVELQSGTGRVLTSTDPSNPVGGLWAKRYRNFGPRVGFAYDLFGNQKAVLRGGYGISYERNFNNVTFNVIQNPPNYAVVALTAGTDVPTIPVTANNAGPFAGASGTKPLGPVSLRAVDPNIKTAYAHIWSAVLEHQFTPDMLGALEYTGSKGVNLYAIDRLNIPGSALIYAGTVTPTTRINNQYSYINFRTNGGFSTYNGLNTRFEMRNFRRQGLTLLTSYTWSHAIDNLSSTFSDSTSNLNLGYLDPLNPALDKGSAEFDVRHRIAVTAEYDVPFKGNNRVYEMIAGGWSIDPIFTAHTGSPFTVYDCTNTAYVLCPRAMYDAPFHASYTQTPTTTPNEFTYMNVGTPDSRYVNPITGVADFGPFPPTMTGRNSFVTPGVWFFNLAVHKNFVITERVRLQFRAEAFNVFNHSNLYIVYNNDDISSTPAITAKRGLRNDSNFVTSSTENGRIENRNLQLALKLIF